MLPYYLGTIIYIFDANCTYLSIEHIIIIIIMAVIAYL